MKLDMELEGVANWEQPIPMEYWGWANKAAADCLHACGLIFSFKDFRYIRRCLLLMMGFGPEGAS